MACCYPSVALSLFVYKGYLANFSVFVYYVSTPPFCGVLSTVVASHTVFMLLYLIFCNKNTFFGRPTLFSSYFPKTYIFPLLDFAGCYFSKSDASHHFLAKLQHLIPGENALSS